MARARPVWSSAFRMLSAVVLGAMLLASGADAAARFGARCQADFPGFPNDTLEYAWERCQMFVDKLDNFDTKVFYFNLHGAQSRFAPACDQCAAGVDNVHLFYVSTHGVSTTKSTDDAILKMWDLDVSARSKTDGWRFGDEATRAAFFAQYACYTLRADDHTVARWLGAFRGGLIMAMGSHDLFYEGAVTNETGEDFAIGLQQGKRVKWAWFDGNADWYADQDVAVLASGSAIPANNALADCLDRRDHVKWQTFGGTTRWRDNQVNYICLAAIDDFDD